MKSDSDDDAQPEAIAVAFDVKTQQVYYKEGDTSTEYPVVMECVTHDTTPLRLLSEIDRVHREVIGVRFIGAEYETPTGVELRGLIDELRACDEEPIEAVKRRLDDLPETLN